MVIHDIFSKFGKVVSISNDTLKVGNFETASGVRLVTLEVSVSEKAAIPHIVSFECGAKALVTMQGWCHGLSILTWYREYRERIFVSGSIDLIER
ncbi:hypothetical protein DPMN_132689 [Dreissena polymorpha]|uniref:Uncharacterized protein n=1 Tax=Dreissena polymorpha TaxID=45954 RepID=A0A9D4FVK7_DREPO|nr:hypothetical protein DPMN_132689 [Dreissena polymorpha]